LFLKKSGIPQLADRLLTYFSTYKTGRMRAVIQRVKSASVVVDGSVKGRIGRGLLILAAVHRDDDEVNSSGG
jgi:hypothetical protein